MTKRIKTKDLKLEIDILYKAIVEEQDRLIKALSERKQILKQKEIDRINSSWIYRFLKKKTIETVHFPMWFRYDMETDLIVSNLRSELRCINELKSSLSTLRSSMRDDSLEQEYDLPVTLIEDIKYYYKILL